MPHTKVNINVSFKTIFEIVPETHQQVRLSERRSSLTLLKREPPDEGLSIPVPAFHLSTLTREPPRASAQTIASSTSRAKGHESSALNDAERCGTGDLLSTTAGT